MSAKFDYVVIGAGIVGLWTAYHLINNRKRVCIIDKSINLQGATAKSGAGIRYYDPDPAITSLVEDSEMIYKTVIKSDSFTPCDHLYVVPSNDTANLLNQASSRGFSILNQNELRKRYAHMNWDFLDHAILDERAGYWNASDVCTQISDYCQRRGTDIRMGCALSNIEQNRESFSVLTSNLTIDAENIIFATGAWTKQLMNKIGIPSYEVNRTITIHYLDYAMPANNTPFIVEHESGFHMRPTNDGQMLFGLPQLDWNIDPDLLPDRSNEQAAKAITSIQKYFGSNPDYSRIRTIRSADSFKSTVEGYRKVSNGIYAFSFGDGASFKYAPAVTLKYLSALLKD